MSLLDIRRFRWWRDPRAVVRQILAVDDSDHAKALGVAIGMFVGLTPTIGLQLVIVVTLAVLTRRLFYFNVPAAMTAVYVSNPLTIVPICWTNYCVGRLVFAGEASAQTMHDVVHYQGLREWWHALGMLFVEVGWPLVFGSLVVAAAAAVLTYPTMRWLLKRYRGAVAETAAGRDAEPVAEPGSGGTGERTGV